MLLKIQYQIRISNYSNIFPSMEWCEAEVGKFDLVLGEAWLWISLWLADACRQRPPLNLWARNYTHR